MLYRQVVAAEQIRYRKPIKVVRFLLKKWNIRPETDVRIYPNYPSGWYATVGANDRVYIITNHRGKITLDIQALHGFRPNGALILKGE